MAVYRSLQEEEIDRRLFDAFIRRQVVTKCFRREKDQWLIKDAPFVDDWGEEDYRELVRCLKNTAVTGGLVCGAFIEGQLKGFVSVEAAPIGSRGQYLDLSSIHVSQDMRGKGIGRELFEAARAFARERGVRKLYISSHSAVESQAFYRAMGCAEAEEYYLPHVEKEPFDCQLEAEV